MFEAARSVTHQKTKNKKVLSCKIEQKPSQFSKSGLINSQFKGSLSDLRQPLATENSLKVKINVFISS